MRLILRRPLGRDPGHRKGTRRGDAPARGPGIRLQIREGRGGPGVPGRDLKGPSLVLARRTRGGRGLPGRPWAGVLALPTLALPLPITGRRPLPQHTHRGETAAQRSCRISSEKMGFQRTGMENREKPLGRAHDEHGSCSSAPSEVLQ